MKDREVRDQRTEKLAKDAAKVQVENLKLLLSKFQDYGSANVEAGGPLGVAFRSLDKVQRLLNLLSQGKGLNHESLEDTFRDLSNYGVLGQLLLQESWPSTNALVYLGGPVDEVSEEVACAWREKTKNHFKGNPRLCFFDPTGAYSGAVRANAEALVRSNREALYHCDVLFVHLKLGTPAFETLREVEAFKARGKRVVLVTDFTSCGLWDLEVYGTLEEAWRALDPFWGKEVGGA